MAAAAEDNVGLLRASCAAEVAVPGLPPDERACGDGPSGASGSGEPCGDSEQRETALMPLKKRNRPDIRHWPRKKKVGSNISKEFPWEVIIWHLAKSAGGVHALVMLQMVDKNVRAVVAADHLLWTHVYKQFVYKRKVPFMMRTVQDPRFPSMLLQISSPGDLPLHSGLIPGDALYADSPARNEEFSRYVRKIVALKFGRHCGMCGARHRHQPYWQLGMRVCTLCFAHNSISAGRLFRDYGVHFADVIAKRHERVFYFQIAPGEKSAKISGADQKCMWELREFSYHHGSFMAWLPHVKEEMLLDLRREEMPGRKEAAQRLSSALRRRWLLALRQRTADRKRPSVDGMLLAMGENEKKRLMQPYGGARRETVHAMGFSWAQPWHQTRNNDSSRVRVVTGVSAEVIHKRLEAWPVRVPEVVF